MKNLLVFPLQKEIDHFITYLESVSVTIIEKDDYFEIPNWNSHLVVGGHGKTQFGIQTQYFLTKFPNTKKVFCLGAAGALSEMISIFDIVVSTETIEHDYTEKFNPEATHPKFEGYFLEDKLDFVYDFDVHSGIVLSGDEDVIEPERAQELFEKFNGLAVAWEGVGGARAAKFNNLPFLEIRGITDNARNDVAESFTRNLPRAMANIAKVVQNYLL